VLLSSHVLIDLIRTGQSSAADRTILNLIELFLVVHPKNTYY